MLVVNSGKGDFRLVVGEVVEDMGEWTWYCVPWCFPFQKPLRYSTLLVSWVVYVTVFNPL